MKNMMMPKKEALKGLISAMKGMQLEKIKGYKKKDDDEPMMEAVMQKKEDDKEDNPDY